jgi:hypothetical protein
VLLSIALQVAVIYTPFLQQTFSTVSLSAGDWLRRGGKLGAVAARVGQTRLTCDLTALHLTFGQTEAPRVAPTDMTFSFLRWENLLEFC